jgi:hypothetical protein
MIYTLQFNVTIAGAVQHVRMALPAGFTAAMYSATAFAYGNSIAGVMSTEPAGTTINFWAHPSGGANYPVGAGIRFAGTLSFPLQ